MLILCVTRSGSAQTTKPIPQIDHVVLISIDGCRPDVLLRGDAPRMRALLKEGTFTFWARSTIVCLTLPTHVSMLTGVIPEAHGMLWNGDMPFSRPVYPNVPTLFELAKKRGYTTAMAVGKSKFSVLDKPGTLDWKYIPDEKKSDDPDVVEHALSIMREHKPGVIFIHLPGVDNAGHAKGWGTTDQLDAVAVADKCVGQVLDLLAQENLSSRTLLIVTADHGGAGRTHGGDDARSRHVPWIAVGPGIHKNLDLTIYPELQVEVYDTFATISAILGIPPQRRTNGKFISQILETDDLLKAATLPSGSGQVK